MELHHGSIVARSEGKGRGATFIVTLPLFPDMTSSIKADAPDTPDSCSSSSLATAASFPTASRSSAPSIAASHVDPLSLRLPSHIELVRIIPLHCPFSAPRSCSAREPGCFSLLRLLLMFAFSANLLFLLPVQLLQFPLLLLCLLLDCLLSLPQP